MKRAILTAALCWPMLTAGMCSTTTPPAPPPSVTCLPMATYTAAQEKALGDAVAALDAASPLVWAVTDYGALRAADRACQAAR